MPDSKQIADILALLKEGRVQDATDVLALHGAAAKQAEDTAAGKPAEPPPPRAPEAILHDFMVFVTGRMGNHQVLEDLAAEYAAVNQLPKKL